MGKKMDAPFELGATSSSKNTLADAKKSSLIFALVGIVSITAIVGSLVFLYLESETNLRTTRNNLQLAADDWEKARSAYVSGNDDELGKALGFAIRKTELASQNENSMIPKETTLAPDEAIKIAKEMPEIRVNDNNVLTTPDLRLIGSIGEVYIQFAGDLSRAQITALNRELKTKGWKMQGESGERIKTAAGLNEIRFSGNNEQAAKTLANAIQTANITSGEIKTHNVSIVKKNTLEVWISN